MGIFSVQDPSNGGSLFRTQADTDFNSFNNPVPTLNMGAPGWGINKNQMTPSYSASYRPQGREGPINSPRPGFFSSVNNQLNPFASSGAAPYADPFWSQQQYRESLYGRPADAAMWSAQNIGIGAGAFWAANKFTPSAATSAKIGASFFRGTAGGMLGNFGTATNIGRATVGGAGIAGGVAGGLFGGMVLPALLAQGAVSAFDSAVFDPYVNQRNTGRQLRENFSGVTFGGGEFGSPHFGRGLNFQTSQQISSDVTRSGFRNFGMSGKDIAGISDMASRAGLLENVNPKDFAKQITAITKQVGIIAAVANDPDFRNSIEIIAKLKAGGANISQAAGIMGRMGGYAGVSGISTQKMMSIASQGEFLHSANNLTPYLGGLGMAQAHASFGAAFRNGLISPALMARMGGVEGAAQSLVTANVNGVQTPYNQAMLASKYLGGMGGSTGSVTGDLSKFGSLMAGSPTKVFGAMQLYSGRMASDQLANDPNALHDQVINIARQVNMMNKNGTLDSGNAYLIARQVTGDHRAAEAFVHDQLSLNKGSNVNNQVAGMRNAFSKDIATMMEANNISGPKEWNRIKGGMKEVGATIQESMHFLWDPLDQASARAQDSLSGHVDAFRFGKNAEINDVEVLTDAERRRASKRSMQQGYLFLNAQQVGDNLGTLSDWGAQLSTKVADSDKVAPIVRGMAYAASATLGAARDMFYDWTGREKNNVGPKSTGGVLDAYGSAISGYENTLIKAQGDTLEGRTDTLAQKEMSKRLGTKDIMTTKGMMAWVEKRGNGNAIDGMKSLGGFRAAAEAYRNTDEGKNDKNFDLNAINGNAQIDAFGGADIQEQFKMRRGALDKATSDLRSRQQSNLISGGAFDANLNHLAAEKNSLAVDKFSEAVDKFATSREPLEYEHWYSTSPKPSKTKGTMAPQPTTGGRRTVDANGRLQ